MLQLFKLTSVQPYFKGDQCAQLTPLVDELIRQATVLTTRSIQQLFWSFHSCSHDLPQQMQLEFQMFFWAIWPLIHVGLKIEIESSLLIPETTVGDSVHLKIFDYFNNRVKSFIKQKYQTFARFNLSNARFSLISVLNLYNFSLFCNIQTFFSFISGAQSETRLKIFGWEHTYNIKTRATYVTTVLWILDDRQTLHPGIKMKLSVSGHGYHRGWGWRWCVSQSKDIFFFQHYFSHISK